MLQVTDADVVRMRAGLFFEGPQLARRLSRFWMLLVLASVIAAAGVVADSTATVIGAMIVAPLMIPILGTMLAVVLADRVNLGRSLALVVGGAAAVVLIGYVLGLLVDVEVVASDNSQVAARVAPRLVDLVAALATGAVGAVALARDDIADTLPGVAIAISLVPPLSVVGLTLESGAPEQAGGALLLFVTNVCAILISGLVVMGAYRVHRRVTVTPDGTTRHVRRGRAVAVIVASVLVVAVPLTITSARISSAELTQAGIEGLARTWAEQAGWEVVSVETRPDRVIVRATGPLPEPETDTLGQSLADSEWAGTEVRVELIPAKTVDL